MEFTKRARGFRHRERLARGAFISHVANAHRISYVFKDEPSFVFAAGMRCETAGAKIRQGLKQALIDLRFVGYISTVAEGIMTLTASVFYEQAPSPARRELASDNLIGK